MATAEELGAFNLAVATGDYSRAAQIAQRAGYSPDVVASYINQNLAGLNLPTSANIAPSVVESLYTPPQTINIPPSSSVLTVAPPPEPPPPPPTSGLNAIAQSVGPTSANVPAPSPQVSLGAPSNITVGPQPEPLPPVVNPVDQQAVGFLNHYYDAIDAGDIRTARGILSRAQDIYGPETLTNVAQDMLSRLDQSMTQAKTTGDFTGAAKLVEAADEIYGGDALQNIADYLNTDLQLLDANKGVRFTPQNLVQFIQQGKDAGVSTGGGEAGTPGTPEGEGAPTAPTGRTIAGIPTYARQEYTPLTFAPVRRGIAQLRPAMYMPGLTSGQAALGGSGFTPEALRTASEGLSPADRAYLMDVGGVSPAELSAATGTPVGQLQAEYNQLRPGGLFGTAAPATTALPEDFVLQTGAYGAPIANPITLTPPTSASAPTPESSFEDQMGYLSNMYLGRPLSPSELSTYRTDFGGTLNRENINDFLSRSQEEMGNRLLVGTNPEAANTQGVKAGGMIKMAEGGEAMAKLSPAEAGSKFDVSEFIDEQGRLVGGYARPNKGDTNLFSVPVRDESGAVIGYEYPGYEFTPYQNFAVDMGDEEARRGLIVRQGMTGVDPYAGGLAGIVAREAMMRNRPQYYSYAKGGLADVAQDLADKGRFGDTMVAHISPQEAGLLKALGGSGTINPQTGLPEFFSLFPKKGIKLNLGPLGNIKIGRKSSDLLLAAAAGYAGATGFMGLNPATAAIGYGGVRAAATGNLMEGIQAGLSAYGMGEGMQAYGVGSPAATPSGAPTTGTGSLSGSPAGVTSANVPLESPLTAPGVGDNASLSALERAELGIRPPMTTPEQFSAASKAAEFSRGQVPLNAPLEIQAVSPDNAAAAASKGFLGRNLPPAVQEYTPKFLLDASGTTLATGTLLGGSLIAGQQERGALAAAQADEERKRRERNARYQALFNQTLGQVRPAKAGGLMKLAGGGMTYMEAGGTTGPTGTPRDVTGTGDGMSDSVPATIEGVQEARLADGEFVIPADVVADIGNGSSDAGSKKLYDMMDRIRMARHGTKEQPPEIKAERLMPA